MCLTINPPKKERICIYSLSCWVGFFGKLHVVVLRDIFRWGREGLWRGGEMDRTAELDWGIKSSDGWVEDEREECLLQVAVCDNFRFCRIC